VDTLEVKRKSLPKTLLARRPEQMIERAVKGMLPKNRLGRAMYRKLFVYAKATNIHMVHKNQNLKLIFKTFKNT
jgi:large subunit ribosomal protein L13